MSLRRCDCRHCSEEFWVEDELVGVFEILDLILISEDCPNMDSYVGNLVRNHGGFFSAPGPPTTPNSLKNDPLGR